MLSPEERRLLVAILLVLMLGAVVKACRSRVAVVERPREALPALNVGTKPAPPAD